MAVSLRFIPGSTIRWREGRFVVVDYAGMDALVAREIGKRRLQRIPVREAVRVRSHRTNVVKGQQDSEKQTVKLAETHCRYIDAMAFFSFH